jgi:transglutaminase-like putative cysteine protease
MTNEHAQAHPAVESRGDEMARYYATPSPTSDLSRHASLLPPSSCEPREASDRARNAVLPLREAVRLRLPLTEDRWEDFTTRSAARIVDRVLARNSAPLSAPREPAMRMFANCYHFALLTCAFLRAAGVPARLRYGFVPYLEPGYYEDHCICEVLLGGRWRRMDPDYGFGIDDDDPKTFIGGGEAWRLCRSGDLDPETVGGVDLLGGDEQRGMWYVRNNLVRDYAALCKVELHPWDWWGLMTAQDAERPNALIDEIAALMADEAAWAQRAERFENDPLLRPGASVVVFGEVGSHHESGEAPLPAVW